MQFFFDRIIKPYIIKNKYIDICEIGASYGGNTNKLLSIYSISLSIIDPCIDEDLLMKYQKNEKVRVYRGLSLEVLSKSSHPYDCFLIDGDHNWYTVYNELKTIHERGLLNKGGTIFFHDVCWPYGRRDMYYLPESIPREFRHSYAKKGIEGGKSALAENSTFNKDLNNAIYEGGPRNGVLTAIEDFLNIYGKKYMFFYFKREFGLGIFIKCGNVKRMVIFFRWFCVLKYYEITEKVLSCIERKCPFLYKYGAQIARIFKIKRYY